MRMISILNQKGGVGKTTTTVNLAAALGAQGQRVLVLDLDPQANATKWLGADTDNRDLLTALTEGSALRPLIRETSAANVFMVPGSLSLSGAERKLAGEVGTEFLLRGLIRELQDYDFILADCPPSLGLLTVNALTAGKEVLVPVVPQILSLDGMHMLMRTIQVVRDRLNPDLDVSGILPVRVDRRTRLTHEVLNQLRESYGDRLLKTHIRENVRLAEAPAAQKPINLHDARSSGAEDYARLAEEIRAQHPDTRPHHIPVVDDSEQDQAESTPDPVPPTDAPADDVATSVTE